MLAYTYIKKYNLRFLKSLGSQLQVYRHPSSTPGGGGRFTFSHGVANLFLLA
jgi:hypothetical protein